jgi:NAD(P) transhydrogenase subunit alpha
MTIGILKEAGNESRVALLPEIVKILAGMKTVVLVERGAGEKAYAPDKDYEAAGARIVPRAEVISKADMLITINPPETKDLDTMTEGKVLVAALNPFFNTDLVRELAARNITSFSMELVPRITRGQSMDILSSQATVAGYKAVLDAASRLPHFMMMFMSAAGTIKPAKVLVLGAGVAGLQAISTARKLGAVVEAFDVRSAVRLEVESLGARFVEVEGARDDKAAGGYAVEQEEDFKRKQAQVIHDHAVKSDIIICTAQIPGRKAPVLIRKETVGAMLPGSVIIDIAASTGGNCELTEEGKVVVVNQVSIVGNSSYPSDMPSDASRMFGRNILNFLQLIINKEGILNLNFEDELVKGTCLTHNKEIVHMSVRETVNKSN